MITTLLTDKFITVKKASSTQEQKISILFKIVSASKLICKEGKVRDAIASIELSNPSDKKDKDREVFNTEVVQSNNPVWNQHMTLQVRDTFKDAVLINVFCKRKDEFLGTSKVMVSELIRKSFVKGLIHMTLQLLPREGKKDKFAGGEVMIEATLDKDVSLFIVLF